RAVRTLVGAVARRRRRPPRRHPHLLQDVVDGRRSAGLPRRPARARGPARPGGAALPPGRGEADRGAARPAVRGRDAGPGGRARGGAGPPRGRAPGAPRRRVPVGGQLRAVPPSRARRPRRVGSPAGRGGAGPRLLVVASPGRLPACHDRHRARGRRLPRGTGGRTAMTRSAAKERSTKETTISVRLDLDGPTGEVRASTGLPFFDHMLDQIGRHGGFDLVVVADGDLHVDGHHTVEDTAITLGECFREAMGDKAGIRRFASGLYPLDEALIEVALDLSGRPYIAYDVPIGEVL